MAARDFNAHYIAAYLAKVCPFSSLRIHSLFARVTNQLTHAQHGFHRLFSNGGLQNEEKNRETEAQLFTGWA